MTRTTPRLEVTLSWVLNNGRGRTKEPGAQAVDPGLIVIVVSRVTIHQVRDDVRLIQERIFDVHAVSSKKSRHIAVVFENLVRPLFVFPV